MGGDIYFGPSWMWPAMFILAGVGAIATVWFFAWLAWWLFMHVRIT